MELGINFPWVSCGHDFGPRPPAWGGDVGPRDWGEVERELSELRALGLTITRWWVLAGGTNYPVGENPAEYAELIPSGDGRLHATVDAVLGQRAGSWVRGVVSSKRYRTFSMKPSAAPPRLPDAFLRDFQGLLGACSRAGVRVIPSLVSFELFQPALVSDSGVVERGRMAFVFPDVDAFLDATLAPLLEAAANERDAVYAFEAINEPDWVVRRGPVQIDRSAYGLTPSPHWVGAADMSRFIDSAVARTVDAGFTATVGFEDGCAPWLDPAVLSRLRGFADDGCYVHQHHHYPTLIGDRELVAASAQPIRPCILGEFPTAPANGVDNVRWRDAALEQDAEHYLEGRLELIAHRGYDAALLWSARSEDSRRRWGASQRRQVADYAAWLTSS